MEALITNKPVFNKKVFVECALAGNLISLSIIMIVGAFLLIDIAYDSYLYKEYLLFIFCILTMLISFSMPFYIYRRKGSKNYKNHILLSDGQETTFNVTSYDNYLTFHKLLLATNADKISSQSTTETTLTHDKISRVYNFKNNFVIVYADHIYVLIQKTAFTKGASEEFKESFLQKGFKMKRKIF